MPQAITSGFELIDATPYGRNGPPHETWAKLRSDSPVYYCEPEGYRPFWAVTRHADVCAISRQPETFLNYPGIMHLPESIGEDRSEGLGAVRSLVEMDPPQHRSFRKVTSHWFTPRAVNRIDTAIEESARRIVDALEHEAQGGEGSCDFVDRVATQHPLRILSSILGIPRDHEPRILELTQQLFANDDPELQREGKSRLEAIQETGLELFQLFDGIIQDRRARPRDDLATVLATGTVDGEPMGPLETLGYYLIVFTAGHDTTKNALAGGLRALAEHPDEYQKLREDPGRIPGLVEEVVRWTSPVNYMRRTAAVDCRVGDQRIAAGDALLLFYGSANRDEALFDDPDVFRADRSPNRHIGFGYGEHFCLGAHLARRSQCALFSELVRRVEHLELAGEPVWIAASFVVGLKKLPLRYRVLGRS